MHPLDSLPHLLPKMEVYFQTFFLKKQQKKTPNRNGCVRYTRIRELLHKSDDGQHESICPSPRPRQHFCPPTPLHASSVSPIGLLWLWLSWEMIVFAAAAFVWLDGFDGRGEDRTSDDQVQGLQGVRSCPPLIPIASNCAAPLYLQ